jgi:RluA family pseudouridine synthase
MADKEEEGKVCGTDRKRAGGPDGAALPVTKKIKKNLSDEMMNETTAYIKDGLRHVRPYYFTFVTHAKGRWVGRTIYDVLHKEFKSEEPSYYERSIAAGKVTVDGKVATMETVVKDNQVISHRVHRHEPPVTAQPLKIIHQDKDFLVINKPSSIPVHPCGKYRHNTVMFMLAETHGIKNIHILYRLDRLTSGLLIFGKTLSKVQEIEEQIRNREVTKEYLALVKGNFPKEPVTCDKPILIQSRNLGVCCVSPLGKSCSTVFTLVAAKDGVSLVKCQPKTGRMHQIRVHLQWLGYPIINDPLYNHPAWGPETGKGRESTDDMVKVITELTEAKFSERKNEGGVDPVTIATDTGDKPTTDTTPDDGRGQDEPFIIDADCSDCHAHHPDPTPNDLVMYLHALKYEGKGWSFSTDPPEWAVEYLNM